MIQYMHTLLSPYVCAGKGWLKMENTCSNSRTETEIYFNNIRLHKKPQSIE